MPYARQCAAIAAFGVSRHIRLILLKRGGWYATINPIVGSVMASRRVSDVRSMVRKTVGKLIGDESNLLLRLDELKELRLRDRRYPMIQRILLVLFARLMRLLSKDWTRRGAMIDEIFHFPF
jgi:hypothetical protein